MSRTFFTFFHHFPKFFHKNNRFFSHLFFILRPWTTVLKTLWQNRLFFVVLGKCEVGLLSPWAPHWGFSWRWEIPPTGWNFSCLEENFGIPQLTSEFWRRMHDFYSLHEASFESIWKWRWGDFLKDPILLVLLVAGRTPATKTQNKPPRLKLRCHVFEGNYDFTKPFANVESQAH